VPAHGQQHQSRETGAPLFILAERGRRHANSVVDHHVLIFLILALLVIVVIVIVVVGRRWRWRWRR
jgi:hypothetical protein